MRFQKVPGGRGSEVGDRRSGIGGRGSEVGDRRAEGGSRWLVFHWPVLQRRDGHFTFFSLHVLFLPLFGFGSLFHPTDVRQPALSFIWERAGGEGRQQRGFGGSAHTSTDLSMSGGLDLRNSALASISYFLFPLLPCFAVAAAAFCYAGTSAIFFIRWYSSSNFLAVAGSRIIRMFSSFCVAAEPVKL